MAEAFSKLIRHFTLVTSGDIKSFFQGMDTQFIEHYNVKDRFNLLRLPVHLNVDYPFADEYWNRNYHRLASIYAQLKKNTLVYTRTISILNRTVKKKIPTVLEYHSPLEDNTIKTIESINKKYLMGVVVTSNYIKYDFLKAGVNEEIIFVTPNGVDLSDFRPEVPKYQARKSLKIGENKKVIVYTGHLYSYKGIDTILKIAEMRPEFYFILVGGWKQDIEDIKRKCEKNNLQNVYLTGHLPKNEMALYLYAADVLLLPTSKFWEEAKVTSPLKLFEYLAVKRPVVASNLPNIANVVSDGIDVLLAEPDNPISFLEKIDMLFNDPSLDEKISQNGYLIAKENSWDRRAKKILRFLDLL